MCFQVGCNLQDGKVNLYINRGQIWITQIMISTRTSSALCNSPARPSTSTSTSKMTRRPHTSCNRQPTINLSSSNQCRWLLSLWSMCWKWPRLLFCFVVYVLTCCLISLEHWNTPSIFVELKTDRWWADGGLTSARPAASQIFRWSFSCRASRPPSRKAAVHLRHIFAKPPQLSSASRNFPPISIFPRSEEHTS